MKRKQNLLSVVAWWQGTGVRSGDKKREMSNVKIHPEFTAVRTRSYSYN